MTIIRMETWHKPFYFSFLKMRVGKKKKKKKDD